MSQQQPNKADNSKLPNKFDFSFEKFEELVSHRHHVITCTNLLQGSSRITLHPKDLQQRLSHDSNPQQHACHRVWHKVVPMHQV